jgi:hypothetical protein
VNLSEVQAMSDEELRFKVAELCGYKWYRLPRPSREPREYRCLLHPTSFTAFDLTPYEESDGTERICNIDFMEREGGVADYPNDLNAMHDAYEFLKSISDGASCRRQPDVRFNLYLMEICNHGKVLWDNGTFLGSVFDGLETANATARQRCIAFIVTMTNQKEER